MSDLDSTHDQPRPVPGPAVEHRLAASAREPGGVVTGMPQLHEWFEDCRARLHTSARPRPLTDLPGWLIEPETGNVVHESGRFFRVEGIDVHQPGAPVERWQQPIIHQPEVGILGILVKEFDGVLHCLMQAKAEPGNCDGVELSPTVQATRSNYTRVHHGRAVPYLEFFQDPAPDSVIVDVRQSEQGGWFRHKRNRNLVVEVRSEVELRDGFCWLTIGQLHRLLRADHLVNMDSRTVLGCLPVSGEQPDTVTGDRDFREALARSCHAGQRAKHRLREILSWITDARTRHTIQVAPVPLRSVRGWRHVDGRITHEQGWFFDIVGVEVQASGREIGHWHQPMLAPHGTGLAALLVRQVDGVLHALMHARVEPGYVDVLELGPTVQYRPQTSEQQEVPPALLAEVRTADRSRVRFDAVHSEEGGRFLHARTRYLVVETDLDAAATDHPDHRWLTLHQLSMLLQHSHYLNIEARSLVACVHSLLVNGPPDGDPVARRPAAGVAAPSDSRERAHP